MYVVGQIWNTRPKLRFTPNLLRMTAENQWLPMESQARCIGFKGEAECFTAEVMYIGGE